MVRSCTPRVRLWKPNKSDEALFQILIWWELTEKVINYLTHTLKLICIVQYMNINWMIGIHKKPMNCFFPSFVFFVSSVLRKCSAITFFWDNCCHFTCPVLWRESTMNLMFVQFLAIFSLVKISTAIANNNGWSIDNPTETFTKMYFFNCTNPQDVIDNGAKPLLKQVEYIWAVLNKFFR